MHQKRQTISTKLPLTRKGNKYVVVASSHKRDAVPVVIAIRDMLKLARSSKEVQSMINQKLLQLNGKTVSSLKTPVKLFNILKADKLYILTILPTKKFTLAPAPSSTSRIAKVINKTILPKNKTQLNLHDGTNVITQEKVSVNESVELSFDGKIKSHIKPEKGKKAFIFLGKHAGHEGKIEEIDEHNNAHLKIKDSDSESLTEIPLSHIIIQ
jgi:small subunit ribosomal protein S4e